MGCTPRRRLLFTKYHHSQPIVCREPAVLGRTDRGVIVTILCRNVRGASAELYRTDKHTHTHPINGPFSGTTQVGRHQKGKTNLDFTGARDSEWQWHQLGHMQVCTSLQTDNHTSTPPLSFYRTGALPAAQPTASKH